MAVSITAYADDDVNAQAPSDEIVAIKDALNEAASESTQAEVSPASDAQLTEAETNEQNPGQESTQDAQKEESESPEQQTSTEPTQEPAEEASQEPETQESDSKYNYVVTVTDTNGNSVDVTGGAETAITDILGNLGYELGENDIIEVDAESIDTDVINVTETEDGQLVLTDNGPFGKAAKNLIIYINGVAIELELVDPYSFYIDALNGNDGNNGAETTPFKTIGKALQAAGTDATTIKLLSDVTASITVAAGQNITLDLNGKTITATDTTAITNNGTLEITGDGTITVSTDANKNVYGIRNKGTLTLTSGTVSAFSEKGTATGIYNEAGASYVNGGTVKAESQGSKYAPKGIYSTGGTTTVTGGEIIGKYSGTNGLTSYGININSGTVNVTGGKINGIMVSSGTLNISGGLFTVDPDEFTDGTHASTDNTDNTTNATYKYVVAASVAKIVDGKDFALVQSAIDAAENGKTVMLISDAKENVTVAAGKDITLDLNNYNLKGTGNGSVITVKGELTLTDNSQAKGGKVTGGTGTYYNTEGSYCNLGGGVFVTPGGKFTLENGTICGNTGEGGGVYCEDSEFVMTGGTITENSGNWGGGVQVKNLTGNGKFTMTGGSITNNTAAQNGGGVQLYKTLFTVGGTANITGNKKSDDTVNNVEIFDGQIIVIDGTDTLTDGAMIGITANTAPTIGSPFAFTGANSADYSQYFSSDNADYVVANEANNVLMLGVPVAEITGGKKHVTLQAAIDAAASGDTVKLLRNITENVSVAAGQDITLNLNEKTLSAVGTAITNSGKLTLTGEGSISVKGDSSNANAYGIYNNAGAELTVNNVTIAAGNASNWSMGIYNFGTAVVTGDKTVISADNTGKEAYGIYSAGSSVTTVSGGKITAAGGTDYCAPVAAGGNSSVTVEGADTQITLGSTSAAFDSGAVLYYGGSIEINGGKFVGVIPENSGTLTVTAGKFDKDPTKLLDTDHAAWAITETPYLFEVKADVVATDGTHGYSKVQNAIDFNAASASIVLLKKSVENITVASGKTITLDLNNNILSGTGNGSVITVYGSFTLEDNSTEKGGVVTGGSTSYGGGVSIYSGSFTMKGGEISDNNATYGGGVYIYSGSFTMEDGKITDNSAYYYGGGVYNYSGIFTMKDGKISDNSASSYGGGVDNDSGTFIMEGGKITGNSAYYGGGVDNFSGTFTMSGGEISGNSASYGGGACNYYGTFTMKNGKITGNSASYSGGGIYVYCGPFTMKDGEITGNSASYGGGIYNYWNTVEITGGKITGNSATYSGGGVYNYDTLKLGGSAVINGNTLTDNVTASNVSLYPGYTITVLSGFNGDVGVNYLGTVEYYNPVAISGANDADYTQFFTPDNAEQIIFNDTDNVLKLGLPIAEVVGGIRYVTLQAAIDAAASGDTVKLLANANESVTVAKKKNIVLDLDGKTVTATDTTAINNKGTLEITGNGIIKVSTDENKSVYGILNTGTLTLTSGTVDAFSKKSAANGIYNSGTAYINGGTVKAEAQGNKYTAKGIYNAKGTTTVTGGEIIGVYSGTKSFTGNGINVKAGTVNVSGGKINGTVINGDTINITGGKFTVDPTEFLDTEHAAWDITEAPYLFEVSDEVVATEGTHGYSSVQKAVNAVADGGTVKMITDSAENVVVTDKVITLNLNGMTLSASSGDTLTVNADDITVIGGTICAENGRGIVTDGDFVVADDLVVVSLNGAAIVSGGDVESTGTVVSENGNAIEAAGRITITIGYYYGGLKSDTDDYAVTGGKFDKDPTKYLDMQHAAWDIDEDPYYFEVRNEIVAIDGTHAYSTVQHAVDAQGDKEAYITMVDFSTEDVTVGEDQVITLDLNGNVLIGDINVTDNGQLTIVDTNEFVGGVIGSITKDEDAKISIMAGMYSERPEYEFVHRDFWAYRNTDPETKEVFPFIVLKYWPVLIIEHIDMDKLTETVQKAIDKFVADGKLTLVNTMEAYMTIDGSKFEVIDGSKFTLVFKTELFEGYEASALKLWKVEADGTITEIEFTVNEYGEIVVENGDLGFYFFTC